MSNVTCGCGQKGIEMERVDSIPYASRLYWIKVQHEYNEGIHWTRMGHKQNVVVEDPPEDLRVDGRVVQ